MRVCVRVCERDSVSVQRAAEEKKKEKRAETEMDIELRQRQERQEYQGNKTNLT